MLTRTKFKVAVRLENGLVNICAKYRWSNLNFVKVTFKHNACT